MPPDRCRRCGRVAEQGKCWLRTFWLMSLSQRRGSALPAHSTPHSSAAQPTRRCRLPPPSAWPDPAQDCARPDQPPRCSCPPRRVTRSAAAWRAPRSRPLRCNEARIEVAGRCRRHAGRRTVSRTRRSRRSPRHLPGEQVRRHAAAAPVRRRAEPRPRVLQIDREIVGASFGSALHQAAHAGQLKVVAHVPGGAVHRSRKAQDEGRALRARSSPPAPAHQLHQRCEMLKPRPVRHNAGWCWRRPGRRSKDRDKVSGPCRCRCLTLEFEPELGSR